MRFPGTWTSSLSLCFMTTAKPPCTMASPASARRSTSPFSVESQTCSVDRGALGVGAACRGSEGAVRSCINWARMHNAEAQPNSVREEAVGRQNIPTTYLVCERKIRGKNMRLRSRWGLLLSSESRCSPGPDRGFVGRRERAEGPIGTGKLRTVRRWACSCHSSRLTANSNSSTRRSYSSAAAAVKAGVPASDDELSSGTWKVVTTAGATAFNIPTAASRRRYAAGERSHQEAA
jgi:hypothetical protein